MTSITVRAPGKVNLQLSVGPLRPDGYHDLVNVFQAVSLFDEVTVAESPYMRVEVRSAQELPVDAVPHDDSNLAVRAARLLAEAVGRPTDVAIGIRKRLPVTGGMAGGSADAAATLIACNELWSAGCTDAELVDLAARLGADVPFMLQGGTAVGTERGERLSPLPTSGQFHWVFAYSSGELSTPMVFHELDRRRDQDGAQPTAPEPLSPDLTAALAEGDAKSLGEVLRNDLQDAALTLRPNLSATLAAGDACGALGAIVSGSGPTCAFLVESYVHALELVATLDSVGDCVAAHYAIGPTGGPSVIG